MIDQDGRARLADFGLLTIMSDSSNQLFSSTEMQGGSQRWMSPELFDPQQFGLENTRPTVQSDSYALGMVVYEVISGRLPFYEYLSSTVSTMILKGQRPVRDADFPDVIWDMLQWCWAAQYSDRPSIKQILQCLEDAIELLRPPSVDEETATTDADNLDYVNPSLGESPHFVYCEAYVFCSWIVCRNPFAHRRGVLLLRLMELRKPLCFMFELRPSWSC